MGCMRTRWPWRWRARSAGSSCPPTTSARRRCAPPPAGRRVRVLFAMAFLPPEPPFSDPGHAEKVETSIILATRPDLVDLSTLPPKGTPLRYREFGIVDGKAFDGRPTPDFTLRPDADPREASADLGRAVLDAEVTRVAAIVSEQAQALGLAAGRT